MADALGKPVIPVRFASDNFSFSGDLPKYIEWRIQGITIDMDTEDRAATIGAIEEALFDASTTSTFAEVMALENI